MQDRKEELKAAELRRSASLEQTTWNVGVGPHRWLDAELFEPHARGVAVVAPSHERRRVPEAPVLHAVDRDLGHEHRLDRDPLEVACRPSTGSDRPACAPPSKLAPPSSCRSSASIARRSAALNDDVCPT